MSDKSQELIRLAFDNAKRSGRTNWYRMHVSVLKNRILQLTDHEFRESDHGALTFIQFVRNHSDILDLDENQWPPTATLKGAHEESGSASESGHAQVRRDLWKAVMDFAGGRRYVWDNDECVARPASGSAADGPAMPTITMEQFTKWKKAFAETVDDTEQDDQFKEWVEKLRPTILLATRVRHRWNDYLKKEVVKYLRDWFREQKLPVPPDIVATREETTRSPDDELRRRLIACVRSMTRDELERVQIPSSVLLRLKL